MSKKKTAKVGPAPPAPPARSRTPWIPAALWLVVLLAGGIATGYTLGLRNTPLGIPLPAKPRPLVQTAGVQIKDSSVVGLRINEKVLDKLAPQPDGTAPLDMLMPSDRCDFVMKFPYGAQFVNLTDDVFKKTQLDSQVTFKYGHPLFLVNASIIRRKGAESYRDAAARLLAKEVRDKAQVINTAEVLPAPETPFFEFAYVHTGPEGDQEFRDIYIGPYGAYLLVLDFMAKAKYQALAQAQAAKIMASFKTNFPKVERFRPQDTAGAAPAI